MKTYFEEKHIHKNGEFMTMAGKELHDTANTGIKYEVIERENWTKILLIS